jgi:hypothetical protein
MARLNYLAGQDGCVAFDAETGFPRTPAARPSVA